MKIGIRTVIIAALCALVFALISAKHEGERAGHIPLALYSKNL
jgi:hypothetical protein